MASLVLVLLAAGAVTLLPVWLLEQSDAQSKRCFDDVVRLAEADGLGCVPAGWRAELPRRLPWLAVEADRLRADVELRATRLAYDRASAIQPERQRRDAMAQRLLELTHGLVPPTGAEEVASMLPGAFATVARFGAERDEKSVREWAFQSARATAALPLLRQLAPRGDAGEPWRLNLERGALACLLGDRAAGLRSLQAADAAFRASSEHGDGLDAARLAIVACVPAGADDVPTPGDETKLDVDPRHVRPASLGLLVALESSLGIAGAVDEARRLLTTAGGVDEGSARLRLLPWALRSLDRPALADALALGVPAYGATAAAAPKPATTPWMLLDRRTNAAWLGFDPVASQSLATDLEAMAANLTAKRDQPVDCSKHGCGTETARAAPGAALARLSRELWFECATEWARRGERDQALAAIARYRAIEPAGPAPELAALLLAVRDAEGALGLLEPGGAAAAGPAAITMRLRSFEADVGRTLALAHLGRFHEAFATAERLWARTEASGSGPEPGSRPDTTANSSAGASASPAAPEVEAVASAAGSRRTAAAWLLAAMATHVGRERDVLGMLPKPPTVNPGERPSPESPLAEVALWLSLGATEPAAEAARRPQRWRLGLRATRDVLVTGVLPAVMDLASRAVPENADVEVWLDRVFDEDHRAQPVLAARARAEAARWRGDGLGAVDWETRAAVLLRLGDGMAGALLGHYAGLR